MTPAEIVAEVSAAGGHVAIDGQDLIVRRVPRRLVEVIREHKPAIMRELLERDQDSASAGADAFSLQRVSCGSAAGHQPCRSAAFLSGRTVRHAAAAARRGSSTIHDREAPARVADHGMELVAVRYVLASARQIALAGET